MRRFLSPMSPRAVSTWELRRRATSYSGAWRTAAKPSCSSLRSSRRSWQSATASSLCATDKSRVRLVERRQQKNESWGWPQGRLFLRVDGVRGYGDKKYTAFRAAFSAEWPQRLGLYFAPATASAGDDPPADCSRMRNP